MPASDLLSILQRIALAYPDKRLEVATLQLYQQELADIPLPLLEQAATHHIRTSPWFPRISELRQAAQQLASQDTIASPDSPAVDYLALEACQLEAAYFQQGQFDRLAWEKLIRQFERVGRPYMAEELHRKADHIQALEQAHARGEHYPPPEECLRYLQGENVP